MADGLALDEYTTKEVNVREWEKSNTNDKKMLLIHA